MNIKINKISKTVSKQPYMYWVNLLGFHGDIG